MPRYVPGHAEPLLLCEACDVDDHDNCTVICEDRLGQLAACPCTCGGGLDAWQVMWR